MRHIIFALLVFLVSSPAWTQEQPSTRQRGKRNRAAQVQQQKQQTEEAKEEQHAAEPAGETFIDADGDGIDDRKNPSGTPSSTDVKKNRARDCDRFIDTDGDGINDNRCSGIGIRRQRRGQAGQGSK